MGWRPRVGLQEGLQQTYDWYLRHAAGSVPATQPAPL
jgi:nucleoside-diphosphate-sugar epimerase